MHNYHKGNIFRNIFFTPQHLLVYPPSECRFPKLDFFSDFRTLCHAIYFIILMCHLIKDAKNHALHAYGWVSKPYTAVCSMTTVSGWYWQYMYSLTVMDTMYVVTTYQGHPTYFLARKKSTTHRYLCIAYLE